MKPRNRQEEIHWNHIIDFQKHITKPRYWSSNKPEFKTRIQCKTCNVYIRWPCTDEINYWNKQTNKHYTLNDWNNQFVHKAPKSPIWEPKNYGNNIVIWLDVPFNEKDMAKELGAKWQYHNKKWYTYSNNNNLDKMIHWLNEEQLDILHQHLCGKGNYQSYT